MTESQIKELASIIADELWAWNEELLNTTSAKNYYLLQSAITEIIEHDQRLNRIAHPDTSQGYNIFGNPKPLRLMSEVKS